VVVFVKILRCTLATVQDVLDVFLSRNATRFFLSLILRSVDRERLFPVPPAYDPTVAAMRCNMNDVTAQHRGILSLESL
jgi:hypothetical protein